MTPRSRTLTALGPFETSGGGGHVMLMADFPIRDDQMAYGVFTANTMGQVFRTVRLGNDGIEIHFKAGTTPEQMALTANVIRAHWVKWIKSHPEQPVEPRPQRIIQRRAPINTPYGKR